MTVPRCSSAFSRVIASARSSRSSKMSPAARSCSARPVSSTSEEVRPKWIHLPAGPTFSATAWTNAATSCFVISSSSFTRSTVNDAFSLMSFRSSAEMWSRRAHPSHARTSIRSQFSKRASSDQTAAISGSVYRGITRSSSKLQALGQVVLEDTEPTTDLLVADPDDLGGEDRRVHGAVDRDGRDRHAGGHLRRGVQRLRSPVVLAGDGNADHREHRPGGHRAGEMAGKPSAANDHGDAAVLRGAGVLVDEVGVPERGHHSDLVRDAELLEHRPGLLQDLELRRRGEEDSDQRLVAHACPPPSIPAAMSVRYRIPSKEMCRAASYARDRASAAVDPLPVTESTRPPTVTTLPSRISVPAWKTFTPSIRAAASRPSIGFPVSYAPG